MRILKQTSSKLFDGFSTCFRQWKAEGTHCKFLHGYGVSFKVWFEGDLDERNWIFDFGGMKRAKGKIEGMAPAEYFAWLLDHTVIVAQDDPCLKEFENLDKIGVIQLRVLPRVGCEVFASYLLEKIDNFVYHETNKRVRAVKLEFFENGKNSATAEVANGS